YLGSGEGANQGMDFVDWTLVALIIISTIQVILDTFETMPELYFEISAVAEIAITIIFSGEYVVRVWISDIDYPKYGTLKARLRFMITPSALIDLIAILPFYLSLFLPLGGSIFRIVRVLRLSRLLKVGHYSTALSAVGKVLKRKASQLVASLAVIGLFLLVASALMYVVENDAQPEAFPNALSGLWWAIITITTVGYGDVYPITFIGRLLGACVALLGVGLVAVPTGIITSGFTEIALESDRYKQDCDK
ncbi:MAG: ion transporter, partial [Firmicutes bacterium]|nr:ion transporter [Bacillota bacterium]